MIFSKLNGLGNDFVITDDRENKYTENLDEMARKLCHRRTGIGADGLVFVRKSETCDVRMQIFNSDGSEAEMCGNGVRCFAKYVYDKGLTDKKNISIETKSGIKELELTVEDGKVSLVKVNMGAPILKAKDIPVDVDTEKCIDSDINVDGKDYKITCVSMGNPHAVTFIDEDVKTFPIEKIGPKFENHPMFPDRVNTEFVQVLNRHEVNMRVWERGSGETLACGTGTCATVVACVLNGLTDDEVTVHLLGGDLFIKYDRENDTVWMTGPAVIAFEGTIEL